MEPTLFRDIIRQSWQIMWKYKFLWLFGFFAALLGNGGELQVLLNNLTSVGDSPATLLSLKNLYSTGLLGVLFVNFRDFLDRSAIEAILFFLIFVTVGVVALWLIITSQGALYDGITRILKQKKTDMAQGYRSGAKYFGRILSISVISGIVTYGLLVIVSAPIVLILLLKSTETGILLYVLFSFLILVPLALIIAFVSKYASLYIVVNDYELSQAVRAGWRLFTANMLSTVEMAFIIFLIGIVGSLGLFVVLAFASVPFILLGFLTLLFYTPVGLTLVIVAGVSVIAAAIILFGAMFSTFRYAAWTIFFHRLVENKGSSKILRIIGQAAEYLGKKPA
ncbi:MAG: hypothetical protein A2898_01260 [Candidatus Kerfeldbacteria bacterium RIFCSPLOWO2_01_FULL_48_11]|uniref:Glycerophosphoryl diester phosphodiesterase membrane domain-containing protein n=1 Tax=Candidatus Kerfeldbacteria bacterium RIFCSPLOWO2_01_FULL_48_11 TaxID=1798543 RepID=A0A1G2B6C0_9BACT|nr:MAG: hypothetical protein UY34_C0016G0006 [Parcubacteria group bacterium GW2011_GWA2_48_9]OGY84711.1 MAG: hypothetical protein A2898_01260 [Candidatus Kerfeldbacteria bacterium RIFCSPLOWO2_01_FULL_48_11]